MCDRNCIATTFCQTGLGRIILTGVKKVGYAQIPHTVQADVPFDIDNSVTVTVDDGAVLVI